MGLNVHMQTNGAPEKAARLARIRISGGRWMIALLGWAGVACAAQAAVQVSPAAALSPAAVVVEPFQAIMLGKAYVASHAGAAFLVGSGDSMLPLYKDHTVVVTQRIAMRDLRAGMTVAYMGDSGRPVAHVLVKKTFLGWVAKGIGNPASDSALVTRDNLIGVVVKAYEPSASLMVALLDEARMRSTIAATP